MKFTPLRASLLALALFGAAGPASATGTAGGQPMLLAQAEAQDFDAIRKFLSGGRDVTQLSDERLLQRLSRAKRFLKTDGLPEDLAQELEQDIAALEAEAERRQQAAAEPAPAPAPAEEPQAAEQQPEAAPAPEPAPEPAQQVAEEPPQPDVQPQPEPQIEQPAAPEASQEQAQQEQPPAEPEAAPETAPQASGEIAAFLASVRPVSDLSEDEIRAQMRRATELARTDGIPQDQRRALREVIRDARTALKSGSEDQQQAQQPEAAQPEPQQPAPAPQPEAQQQAQPQPQPEAQPPAAEQPQEQAQQAPQVDPALEQQARAILDDTVDVSTLERRELRQRLNQIRDLLATNQLSPETRDALREKLARERQVLRAEVRAAEQGQQPQQQGGGTPNTTANATTANTTVTTNNVTVNNTTTITNTEIKVALRDQRPPEELDDQELIRRIDIYRDVVRDDRYDEEERQAWRRALERDRRYLRRQMLEERRARAERLRAGEIAFSVRIDDDYDADHEVPDDVFAAEVEDEELAEVLTAPPRRKVQRRYTVEDFERSPEARASVARIEIDTVHFGFGEGFLREEEIDKLDRIAQVLEGILAKNPDEVFLLEGHTDAVGSDASNLALSRQRAQAVKEALTTYYVIPAGNLKTVGLGERYLKIPTQQAEAENRRVSLARVTALVGRAD